MPLTKEADLIQSNLLLLLLLLLLFIIAFIITIIIITIYYCLQRACERSEILKGGNLERV